MKKNTGEYLLFERRDAETQRLFLFLADLQIIKTLRLCFFAFKKHLIERPISIFSMLFAVLLVSCNGDKYIESEPEIVVEGWICEGDFPIVFVTTSVPMSQKKRPMEEIRNHVLNWARVVVSDGDESVVLTGRVNSRYPLHCYFTSNSMRGKVGKTYHIWVDYEDFHAEATTTIHARPTLDSLTVERTAGSDTLYTIMAHIPPQVDNTGYYKFLVGIEGEMNDYSDSYMGLLSDQNIGQGATFPVYRPHQKTIDTHFIPNFRSGDRVHVRFASIDETSYNFWNSYEKNISLGNNVLFPLSENLPSNIKGGLGIWYGYAASEYFVEIP